MLTTMFYYDYYKPFIIEDRSRQLKRRQPLTMPVSDSDTKVLLNKSLKSEIITYARRVSGDLNNLSGSTRKLLYDVDNFNKHVHDGRLGSAKQKITEDLEFLAKTYNLSEDFLSKQEHSPMLSELLNRLKGFFMAYEDNFKSLGLTLSDDGKLSFNQETFSGLSYIGVNRLIGENYQVINELDDIVTAATDAPLSEHMNFRGLSYYYNYKMGTVSASTFMLIETGMIVDVAM